jgi:hypothetical protein
MVFAKDTRHQHLDCHILDNVDHLFGSQLSNIYLIIEMEESLEWLGAPSVRDAGYSPQ